MILKFKNTSTLRVIPVKQARNHLGSKKDKVVTEKNLESMIGASI